MHHDTMYHIIEFGLGPSDRAASMKQRSRYGLLTGGSCSLGRWAALRPLAGVIALAVLLLFVQELELTHSHDGLPERQAGCEICIKLGSASEPLASVRSGYVAKPGRDARIPAGPALSAVSPPVPRSRAPPVI